MPLPPASPPAQEHGLRRLRAALSSSDSHAFMRDYVVPFLAVLGSDALARGTCKQPVAQLSEAVYQVPGLLGCLHAAVAARAVPDPAPVGLLLLRVAAAVEGARTDPAVRQLVEPLKAMGGGGAAAARQLEVVLAGAAAGEGGGGGGGAALDVSGLAVEDLQMHAGGRHDNDQADFRSIRVMPTSDEVRRGWGRALRACALVPRTRSPPKHTDRCTRCIAILLP
jgi:hypothetical protein